MKKTTVKELKTFLASLQDQYKVCVPIKLHDGTRALGSLEDGELALFGGKIPRKPTSIFFAQSEQVLSDGEGQKTQMSEYTGKPLFVVGLTAEDLDCLEFIDRFFSSNYKDPLYSSRRNASVVVGVTGYSQGNKDEFNKISGGKCDLELVCDGQDFVVAAYTDKGKDLENKISSSVQDASLDDLQKVSDTLPQTDLQTIEKAGELIRSNKVPDEFWNEIATQCISCTACNLSCPTCTCFDVVDAKQAQSFSRRRIWDSCLLDGFQRETSGHNPMNSEGQRTRRRIHHKLAADYQRWGHITCMMCGRCDDVCPTGIGIKAVCQQIVDRYQ